MPDSHLPSFVRIGGMDKQALLSALRAHDIQLNQAAENLFADPRFTPTSSSVAIAIACLSVTELGFPSGATYEQLTARALELGLLECPLELGPYLRLQFLEQPEAAGAVTESQHRAPAGSITVVSRVLDATVETPKGFYLRQIAGRLWLRGYWSPPSHIWSPEDVLVFSASAR
ncbi:MAG: helicase [Polyangiaceae bacterium]